MYCGGKHKFEDCEKRAAKKASYNGPSTQIRVIQAGSSNQLRFILLSTDQIPYSVLIDSGATRSFINKGLVDKCSLSTTLLEEPLPLFSFDSSAEPMQVLKEKVLWTFSFSTFPAFEWECLVVDAPGKDDTILGYDFLSYWNPDIDWNQGLINLRTNHSTNPNAPLSLALLELNSQPSPIASSGIPSLPRGSLPLVPFSFPSAKTPTEPNDLFEDFEVCIRVLNTGSSQAVFESDFFDETPEDLESILPTIPEAYHVFASIFSKISADKLPPCRSCDHRIDLFGPVPKKGPIYRLSKPEDKVLWEYIAENVSRGFIRPSTSATGFPVLFVPKANKTLRLCVDYRRLNEVTEKTLIQFLRCLTLLLPSMKQSFHKN